MKNQIFLLPFTAIYRAAISLRSFLYRAGVLNSQRASLPTFCVGNVIAGGSGKTPFTAFLVETLKELGFKPAILLRGYKGKELGPKLVQATDLVSAVGDEALMHLQTNVPVVIAKKRAQGVNFIKEKNLANCIVMDDGLQHLSLKAQHNFLLLEVSDQEAINKWQTGKLLPAGYLREPLEQALERADSIVLVNKLNDQFININIRKKIFKFRLSSEKIFDLSDPEKSEIAINTLTEANILCTIANPLSFIKTLENLKIRINEKFIFPDHYEITQSDWGKVKFPLITTSKDAIKLKKFVQNENKVFVLEQKASICDTAGLKRLIKEVLT